MKLSFKCMLGCMLGCMIVLANISFASAKDKESAVTYVIKTPTPFSEDSNIAPNIKKECKLGEKLANFIIDYGEDYDIPIKFEGGSDTPKDAVALTVEITDAVAGGNAFTGHRKYTTITGFIPGQGDSKISFDAMRYSGGGAFGGFKGNCAVLGRTTKVLGKDVAKWLRKRKDGAQLGDL